MCQGHYRRLRDGYRATGPLREHHPRGSQVCKVHGCVRAVRARGMCPRHYDRWQTYGDRFEEKLAEEREAAEQVAEAERSLELKEWQDYINNLFKD